MSHIDHLISELEHNKQYDIGHLTATDVDNRHCAELLVQYINNRKRFNYEVESL